MVIRPFPEQQAVLDSDARFLAVVCGIQSGKTMTGAVWLIEQILNYPHDDFLIAAPTYKILEQSTIKKFFEIFPLHTAIYRKQDATLEIIHGGKIYIRSTEIPNNIEGMTIRAGWLDEAGMMKPQVWTNVLGRVAIKSGRVIMTTTPYNLGWLYREVVRQAESKNPEYALFNWSSLANPYFPKDEFERAKSRMSTADFERRYLGKFRKQEGLVYPDWETDSMTENTPPDEKEVKEVVCGVDYGFSNPCAIIPIVITKDDRLHVVDEVYETRLTVAEIVERCREMQEKWGVGMFYADPSNPALIEALNYAGLSTTPANNDIDGGIGRVRTLIKAHRLRIWFAAYNLLDEIENYQYSSSAAQGMELVPEFKNKPDKIYDHAVDALRYVVATHPLDIYTVPATQAEATRNRFWTDVAERIEKRKMRIERYGEDFSDEDVETIESVFG